MNSEEINKLIRNKTLNPQTTMGYLNSTFRRTSEQFLLVYKNYYQMLDPVDSSLETSEINQIEKKDLKNKLSRILMKTASNYLGMLILIEEHHRDQRKLYKKNIRDIEELKKEIILLLQEIS